MGRNPEKILHVAGIQVKGGFLPHLASFGIPRTSKGPKMTVLGQNGAFGGPGPPQEGLGSSLRCMVTMPAIQTGPLTLLVITYSPRGQSQDL